MKPTIKAVIFTALFFLLIGADKGSLFQTTITGGDELKVADVKADTLGDNRLYVDAFTHGTAQTTPGAVSDHFFSYLINDVSSTSDMRVDGTAPVGESSKVDFPITTGTGIGGECWKLDTPGTAYYVWYDTDNGSTDPAPASRTAIEVDVLAADTNVEIATKTKNVLAAMTSDFTDVFKTLPDIIEYKNVATGNVTDMVDCSPPDNSGVITTVLIQGRSTGATVKFELGTDATKDKIITQIRCFGGGNGVQFSNFLSQPSALEQGLILSVKSGGAVFSLPAIKTTEDFKNTMAIPSSDQFSIDVQAGADQFISMYTPTPFTLDKASSDYIRVEVRDDLTSGLLALDCAAIGFLR